MSNKTLPDTEYIDFAYYSLFMEHYLYSKTSLSCPLAFLSGVWAIRTNPTRPSNKGSYFCDGPETVMHTAMNYTVQSLASP